LALSHHALRILGYAIDIRTLNLGTFDKRCILLNGLENAERKGVAVPWEDDPPITFKSPEHLDANILLYKCFMDRSAVFKLQADVNQSKLFGITPNLTEMLNMAELRQVTTVFIKLQSLNSTDIDTILAESQKAIMAVLYALHRFEGSLRQFHVDDKGAVILCFFGLPPLAHDNDAKLGMEAALEIKEKFSETGMFEEFAMGVTTGVVSYGGVGTNGRAEYAVVS
jgi:hypothetical protein